MVPLSGMEEQIPSARELAFDSFQNEKAIALMWLKGTITPPKAPTVYTQVGSDLGSQEPRSLEPLFLVIYSQ
jgi:hypothetical protein